MRLVNAKPLFVFGFRGLFFLLFFGNDFSALVMSAAWTNRVRQAHLTAVAAGDQVAGLQGVVCAPPVPASLG